MGVRSCVALPLECTTYGLGPMGEGVIMRLWHIT